MTYEDRRNFRENIEHIRAKYFGKLAAIEARITQFPASTNDAVWLLGVVRKMQTALEYYADEANYFDGDKNDCDPDIAIEALVVLDEPNPGFQRGADPERGRGQR